MKISHIHPGRRNQSGMATMVFMVLLMIMMILVIAESRALLHLNRETKFLEQQQIKRLNGPPAAAIAITNTTK
jgi:Tfp pilus assembly protein PilX